MKRHNNRVGNQYVVATFWTHILERTRGIENGKKGDYQSKKKWFTITEPSVV